MSDSDTGIQAGEPPLRSAAGPRRTSLPWHWLRNCFFILLACSLLTGGIYVDNRTHVFEGNRPANPTVSVEVLYDFHETGIPLLFQYAAFKHPYRLTMSIFDARKNFDRIEIDEVELVMQDGEVFHGMQNWRRDLREGDWMLSAYHGDVAVYHVSKILDLAIPKAEPCSIRLKGRLRTKDGKLIPLDRKMDFKVDRQLRVFPYWLVVYGKMLV